MSLPATATRVSPLSHAQIRAAKGWMAFFVAFGLADLISLSLGEEGLWGHRIAKSQLMPCLIGYAWTCRTSVPHWPWLLAALAFSWLGDLCLLGQGSTWFILGLGSFLLAHLCYLQLFGVRSAMRRGSLLRRKPWVMLPPIAWGAGLLWLLWSGLGELQLPVMLYASVITLMLLAAIARFDRASRASFRWVLMGAILFVVSDSLIAMSKFGEDFFTTAAMSGWIMGTYVLAQGFIAWGMTR